MPSHPPIVESRPTLELVWHDEADTAAWARTLARQSGLRDACIELRGELGAGKTTFVRHLLRALGVRGRIKSPTYALLEPHEGPDGLAISHFDFYRFGDPREWEDAGLRDVFVAPGLKLVEWPERAAPLLPTADLVLELRVEADARRAVRVHAHTALGARLLQGLSA
ncbi:MAG TPA: tRNA (adenosine(37)-N6)-threonylcarbamoyltransferase complex ATPase subunit type 1 TsaE [Ottowia sp.]|uniref:tRNA (adenosine(37)-N6)-threonylcarbamoyltransferase complex ATPase subunit type 1 TsaE n=1 Tax=Ottowia sp. TaxID=1898956 RepID=UPI002C1409BB|nr:tRNA (adenosine(37)-N6)-threonylcarbamoyltransferase complex ATPase subunit type 1 TsaE [Ottowia sp.]HMN21166.1 tRNA (adenosine(37)-N6)-threonylcarbamoyltransferase complex ATPase subunit type 1 TsaE [Ottowia sp.]